MNRTDLKTELTNAWDAEIAKLTPDERKRLAATTPADWIGAIADLVTDPGFWGELGTAFLQGMARGIEKHR